MSMELADLGTLAIIFDSVVTPIGLIFAGVWAYRRYIVEESNYPHIETSAEIEFVGQQGDYWIVELRAVLENKGRVQHRVQEFGFDLNALFADDPIEASKRLGSQVSFPHTVAKGSFLPKDFSYFAVGPAVVAKYSYVANVPKKSRFLTLHCWFEYMDGRGYSHTMEKTVAVPAS